MTNRRSFNPMIAAGVASLKRCNMKTRVASTRRTPPVAEITR